MGPGFLFQTVKWCICYLAWVVGDRPRCAKGNIMNRVTGAWDCCQDGAGQCYLWRCWGLRRLCSRRRGRRRKEKRTTLHHKRGRFISRSIRSVPETQPQNHPAGSQAAPAAHNRPLRAPRPAAIAPADLRVARNTRAIARGRGPNRMSTKGRQGDEAGRPWAVRGVPLAPSLTGTTPGPRPPGSDQNGQHDGLPGAGRRAPGLYTTCPAAR